MLAQASIVLLVVGKMSKRKPNSPASSQQKSPIVKQQTIAQQSFAGPLPHPDILQKYNVIVPDAAERIISMAEQDAKHTRSMEAVALEKAASEARFGQVLGFLSVCLAMSITGLAIVYDKPWVASIIGGATLVSIVTIFIKGR